MRLPVEPIPRLPAPKDLFAIYRKPAVTGAPRIAGEAAATPARAPSPPPPEREPPGFAEALRRQVQAGETPPPLSDRRRYCRRVTNQQVLLDTRSGEDRRHGARRESDPVLGVDEEI